MIDEILSFWFGETPPEGPVAPGRLQFWFGGEESTDSEIRERFGPAVEKALGGEFAEWRKTPRGTLALILLLDQFPRNIYRGSAAAYAGDERALDLCRNGRAAGIDRSLATLERAFFYLPLEHAEDTGAQAESVRAFTELLAEAPRPLAETCRGFLDYAIRHQMIIDRFGRFPHRNGVLGRPATSGEEEFLTQPGSSF